MSDFYGSQFPGGKRLKANKPAGIDEPVAETSQQPQAINHAPGIDSLPPVPEDYEVPTETAQAAPEEEQTVSPEPEVTLQTPVVDNMAATEATQAKNFRQLREAKERAERELEETRRLLQQQYKPTADKVSTDEPEFNYNINPDELVEGKHFNQVLNHVKRLEQELKQQRQQVNLTSEQTKLRVDFRDFDAVVNEDNFELLRMRYPAIYNTLEASAKNGNLYDTGVSTYTMMKQLGIHKEHTYEADKAKIQANAAKPKPVASISPQKAESPLSHANAFAQGLTPELSKNLWKEMQEIRRKS